MYKVLAKVLAERIKSVMESVVSQAQFAFMKNRQITDCILIANEVIHSLKKSKNDGLILKVDFEKAYDIIEWTFLDRILEEMNFGSKWRKLIQFCLSSATAAVLVNGSPTEFFPMKRGLRQGDPLSHFLFNIVSEGFNVLLTQAKEVGLFSPVDVGRAKSFLISHLQFADDTLIFCKAEALWRKLIDAKYERIEHRLSPSIPSKALVSPVWKKITDILHSMSPSGVVAKQANKSGLVCDFKMWENGQWKWNVNLRRNLFDWEVEQFNSFMLILNSVVMMATRNDKVIWSFDSLGKFSSRSFGKEIKNSSYSDPLLHSVWKFKVPPKARVLCWQSIVGKLPTRDVLLRIGIIAQNQSKCHGKPGPAGIGGVLRNNCGVVLALFSISVGVLDSNVAEVMAIKEACRMVNENLHLSVSRIIVESDSLNESKRSNSTSINMVPNGDEASTSHNMFNERLEDAYFGVSTSFHDPSNVQTYYQPYPHEKKWTKDHPLHKIIGDPKSSVRTRGQLANSCLFSCLLSFIEPANVAEALRDADWVSAMQEELDQFARLKVWRLVPRSDDKSVIKTKWIFKNKKDESSLVIRNKARLVAVGYSKKNTYILYSMSPSGVVAKKGLVHHVGKGDCTRFWDDHWVEGHILKTSFSRIFALAANKSGLVCDFGLWENGQWKWNVNLKRNLFDWEVEQFDSFMLILNSVVMMATRNEKVVRLFDSLGKFSSRSFGKEMENSSYSDPLLHSVWKFKVPPKAHLLCWQSIIGKLPTRDVLLRIGIIAQNQYNCPLCNSCTESIYHLFIHYSNVAKVMAIKEACRMVNENLNLSASRIIVESDSLNAVSWVRHPLERTWRLLSHFQEIDLFLSSNGNRSIAHIKREGNCEADKLAKEGIFRLVPLSI
nr:cysteine-rich receptor-like protein kinase [Tanacetum cinerariifolium]